TGSGVSPATQPEITQRQHAVARNGSRGCQRTFGDGSGKKFVNGWPGRYYVPGDGYDDGETFALSTGAIDVPDGDPDLLPAPAVPWLDWGTTH
ncbi:hypothetical protein ACFO1B_39580, partial [Dactylosporangium siamense]|uniref:hypothetical protein n=1 Tax=Dactylosporangium siamense TaxID=685454 RepID=UPI003607283F